MKSDFLTGPGGRAVGECRSARKSRGTGTARASNPREEGKNDYSTGSYRGRLHSGILKRISRFNRRNRWNRRLSSALEHIRRPGSFIHGAAKSLIPAGFPPRRCLPGSSERGDGADDAVRQACGRKNTSAGGMKKAAMMGPSGRAAGPDRERRSQRRCLRSQAGLSLLRPYRLGGKAPVEQRGDVGRTIAVRRWRIACPGLFPGSFRRWRPGYCRRFPCAE